MPSRSPRAWLQGGASTLVSLASRLEFAENVEQRFHELLIGERIAAAPGIDSHLHQTGPAQSREVFRHCGLVET